MSKLLPALVLLGALLSAPGGTVPAAAFVCSEQTLQALQPPSRPGTQGTRRAIILFAQFAGQNAAGTPPSWTVGLFDADRPGSISHFYDTMSLGRLRLRGQVAPLQYEAAQTADAYLAPGPGELGDFGRFSLEILQVADADIDFSRFDNDGPDGLPDSGDDDGFVDALFIVLPRVPTNFLVGGATGLAHLGLETDYVTQDRGSAGEPIRISPHQGTIQQGAHFAEAAGVICHEYGHLLGLPDLFNTAFLRAEDPRPEDDSAGIGNWGLMGWGASGWNGDDGPTSFSAWSRLQLGWAQVETVGQLQGEIEVEDVGRNGQLHRILLSNQEYFLLEYRRRTSTYYDRGIPGEGLLVWHVDGQSLAPTIDLECADGQWLDAGFPSGVEPDPEIGGDNLDFWAHDQAYSRAHQGNLGDATDPFDGRRFTAFTPQTNPAATSNDGRWSVRLEDIRPEGETMRVEVAARPIVEVVGMIFRDANSDGVLVPGEPTEISLSLVSVGTPIGDELRLDLSSADSLVQVEESQALYFLSPSSRFAGNPVTYRLEGPAHRLRLEGPFVGTYSARLNLSMSVRQGEDWIFIWQQEIVLQATSPRQELLKVAVLDSLGNGDGRAQAGELIRLRLALDLARVEGLRALRFDLRSLHSEVHLLGSPKVSFRGAHRYLGETVHSPEFLLDSALQPGTPLPFELEVDSGFEVWLDTFTVDLTAGPDPSPPRLAPLQTRSLAGDLVIALPTDLVWDGSPVTHVEARFYSPSDTLLQDVVALADDGTAFSGQWTRAWPGNYLLEGRAVDAAGNQGRSRLQAIVVEGPGEAPLPQARLLPDGGRRQNTAAYAPDGRLLAVAADREIRLFQTADLEQSGLLAGHTQPVTSLAFGPDGERLISGGRDGTVRLWDTDQGRELAAFTHPDGPVQAVAFSLLGQLAAAAGGSVHLWDTRGGSATTLGRGRPGVDFGVLAFDPNGRLLAGGAADGTVHLWTMWNGALELLEGHDRRVDAVAFSPDGQALASGGRDGRVRVWDLFGNSNLRLDGHADWVRTVAFSPDGQWLLSGGWDGLLLRWDRVGFQRAEAATQLGTGIEQLAFAKPGAELLARTWKGTFLLNADTAGATGQRAEVSALTAFPAYPNPFNSGIWIPYHLTHTGEVAIIIYNPAGQQVRRLSLGRRSPGYYFGPQGAAFWDGRLKNGQRAATGLYLYILQTGETSISRKMLLLR
ncbi:MAG: hypothetical protein GKR89_16935 [Candidatus Latescibacteria bacterium]|nr:hypothetical protein [Candidatus Latescibacterota bacterium]